MKKDESSSSSSSSDDDSSSDEEDDKKKDSAVAGKTKAKAEKDDSSSSDSSDSDSDDSDSDSSDSESDKETSKKRKEGTDDSAETSEPPKKKQAVSSESNDDGMTKVYIRGLPWRAADDQVREFFQSCGSGPKTVELPLQDDGRSSGTAIVDFHDAASAAAALELNGNDFEGRWLSIKYSTPKPILSARQPSEKQEGCTTVFVGNLSWDIDEDSLRDAFKDCGTITQVRFSTDRETGDFKG